MNTRFSSSRLANPDGRTAAVVPADLPAAPASGGDRPDQGWRCARLAARLFRTLLLLCAVPNGWAAPNLWVDARLDPAEVYVNAQATLIVRFGHAVDVRSPRFDAPPVRLAEVIPLGQHAPSEEVRGGVRYRVLERRYAVLPFASGDLLLNATVSGATPALPADSAGRAGFSLGAPALRLAVRPAASPSNWLPADRLQFSADNATPGVLRVGDVWTRHLLIEADGVDGSVIVPPRWPESAGWSLQFDPPEVGRRIEDGRVIGYRRQTVHAQVLQPGRQDFPVPRLAWWHVPTGQWRDSAPAPASVDVEAVAADSASPAGRHDKVGSLESIKSARDAPGENAHWTKIWLLGGVLLLLAAGVLWRRSGHRALHLAWRRRQHWRALATACRNNDASAARRALLAWGAVCGLPARSLAADAVGHPLASAIAALEAACFGPRGGGWNGRELRRAFPELARLRR